MNLDIIKCDNGKYKIGPNGVCSYESKADAERVVRVWRELQRDDVHIRRGDARRE